MRALRRDKVVAPLLAQLQTLGCESGITRRFVALLNRSIGAGVGQVETQEDLRLLSRLGCDPLRFPLEDMLSSVTRPHSALTRTAAKAYAEYASQAVWEMARNNEEGAAAVAVASAAAVSSSSSSSNGVSSHGGGGPASPRNRGVQQQQLKPSAGVGGTRLQRIEERKETDSAMTSAIGSGGGGGGNRSKNSKSGSKSDRHVSFSDDTRDGPGYAEEEEEKKGNLPLPSQLLPFRSDKQRGSSDDAEGSSSSLSDPPCADNLSSALEFKCAKACSSWLKHRLTSLRREEVVPWEPELSAAMMAQLLPHDWAAATMTAVVVPTAPGAGGRGRLFSFGSGDVDAAAAAAEEEAAAARLVDIYGGGGGGGRSNGGEPGGTRASDEVMEMQPRAAKHQHPLQSLSPLGMGMGMQMTDLLPADQQPGALPRSPSVGNASVVRIHHFTPDSSGGGGNGNGFGPRGSTSGHDSAFG